MNIPQYKNYDFQCIAYPLKLIRFLAMSMLREM